MLRLGKGVHRQVHLEGQVVAIVTAMLAEMHRDVAIIQVTLGSHLERDLGLFSLERVVLFMRLEEACGVPIPEDVVGRVESVADLIAAMTGQPSSTTVAAPQAPGREASDPHHAGHGSLLFTAYVAMLLAAIAVPAWVLAGLVRGRRAAWLMRRAARLLVDAAGLPVTVTGLSHLPSTAPAVLVANHQSYLDSIILLAVLPFDVNVAVNERLACSRVLGRFVRSAGYLVADRTSIHSRLQCAARMTDIVRTGESLLAFPEGTFPLAAPLLPFRLGPFAAAANAGRPVVPIAIEGTREVLPWGTWLLRPSAIRVTVHRPFHPSHDGWREAVRLRAETQDLLARSLAGTGAIREAEGG